MADRLSNSDAFAEGIATCGRGKQVLDYSAVLLPFVVGYLPSTGNRPSR